jgi:acyl-CoA thioester hydrolase
VHQTPIRVRFDEVDTMGVVHHPRYLVYFEVARTEYLRDLGLAYADVMHTGTHFAVVEAGARYLRPARYDDELSVSTRVSHCGGARFTLEYEVRRADELLATGFTLLGAVDTSGRPVRLPHAARELLAGAVPGPAAAPAAEE